MTTTTTIDEILGLLYAADTDLYEAYCAMKEAQYQAEWRDACVIDARGDLLDGLCTIHDVQVALDAALQAWEAHADAVARRDKIRAAIRRYESLIQIMS